METTEIEMMEDPKIALFFSNRQKKNTRNAIAYCRAGDYVIVDLISNTKRQERRSFKIGQDDEEFCRFAFDKIGIDFKSYNKRKKKENTIMWQ